MATSRALITNKSDFIRNGISGLEFNPDLFFNMEDQPANFLLTRTPLDVPGVRGIAKDLNSQAHYRVKNVTFDAQKNMFSMWVKFKPSAFQSGKWTIIFTTRGTPSASDHGFHLAMYNSAEGNGQIIARLYKNGSLVENQESHKMTVIPAFNAQPDVWYHVVFIYDVSPENTGYKLKVYFNNTLVVVGSTDVGLGAFTRDLTIGQLSATDANTYPPDMIVDEFMFFKGSKVWDAATIGTYYNGILDGRYVDYSTEPGSIQIPKRADGTYLTATPIVWESNVIDIGDPPIDYYGRLHMNAALDPSVHTINLYTRVSDDGVNFDSWQAVGADGTIYSPKKRYYQIKVELMTSSNVSTPVLKELEILEYARPIQYELISEPLRVFADLETGLKSLGILHNAYDIWIEEELKSKDILTFKLPMTDPKRRMLGNEAVEYLLQLGNRRYIIKENRDVKGSDGKRISEFKAEAKWYELNDCKIPEYELVEATVTEHVQKILSEAIPTPTWRIGVNTSTKTQKRTIRGTWKSALALLREVESTFGVELRFYYDPESDQDLIDITDMIGEDKRIRFYYNKNIKEIERIIDTYGMVTRLYLYGAGELDITTVNNGLPYIENLEWVNKLRLRNKIRPDYFRDERYTIPQNLLEDGQRMLAELSKPNITYSMKLLELSSRSGHEPETIHLGDTVYPIDEDLMIDHLPSRIVRRKYNVREPYKSEVELDQPKKELAEVQSRAFEDQIQVLTESDPVSNADIQEMTVFNHLLNSRADDGLAEWTQVGAPGITASTEGGFSGENSFKITANYGEYKSIYQDVYNLSHRSTYTISAMVYKEGNITAGANGFVGIRIRVRYKPDENGVVKEEVKLLKIPDVTNMSYDDQ